MKRLHILIPLLLLLFTANAQTVYKNYIDGQAYFAISHKQYQDLTQTNIKFKKTHNYLNDFNFLKSVLKKYNGTEVKQIFSNATEENILRIFRIKFDNISQVDELVSELSKINGIYNAEKVPLYHLSATTNDPYNGTVGNVNWNWPLDVVNASGAWDVAFGNNSISVGIVDGAILNTHEDINDVVVAAYDGQTQTTGSSAPPSNTYEWSHGTHCAGLIGAETNNNIGISSLGSGVGLYTAKCGRNSDGALYYMSEALNWIAGQPIKVLSLSLGGPSSSTNEQDFYTYLHNTNDVVILAAAGNGGADGIGDNEETFPAAYDNVIAVASTDQDDSRSSFSNYGNTWVDIAAPGGSSSQGAGLLSSTACDATDASSGIAPSDYGISGQYNMMSGTSMATPLSAGLVGLMRSLNPTLSATDIENCLFNTCVDVGTFVAHGRIDAAAAMQCVQSTLSGDPIANFSASSTTIAEGDAINFTDLSTDGGTAITSWSWSFPGGTPSSSTSQNPQNITYATAGTYNVSLTVNNGTSDTETKTGYITVIAPSTNCDTLDVYGLGTATATLYGVSASNGGGYLSGSNGYGDEKKANFYNHSLSTNNNLEGATFYFGVATSGTNPNITFEILDGASGTPGTALATITKPLNEIADAVTNNNGAYYVDFGGVQVTNDFFVSFSCNLDMSSGDTIAVITNTDGDVSDANLAWEYYSSAWHTVNSGWSVTLSNAIFPVLCPDSSTRVQSATDTDINIYPNPNNGQFTIALSNKEKALVNIYDLNGRMVYENQQTSLKKNYNLSELHSGIYIVKIMTQNTISTKKITLK